jgi:DNA-binding NtrC family response regulator
MTTSAMLAPPDGGVLVASASLSLREQVRHSFNDRRWPVEEALGGADALVKLETGNWQVLFLDRRVPDLDAEELTQIVRQRFPELEVVMLDSENVHVLPLAGAGALRPHAWLKPPEIRSSAVVEISAALPCREPETEPTAEAAPEAAPLPGMIGDTDAMRHVYRLARLVAPRLTTVLILGPTGTGKELLARALHRLSPRAARPFVVVNCAAIPETLMESELFGHTRGAFTGAVQASTGRILAAQGGTLFLDEVGELPVSLQAKLLRFLDQKEVQRLGSTEAVRIDVRVVAATNADLEQRVREGRFRSDLYYRLSAFPLELPSLSERVADILLLAEFFLRHLGPSGASPLRLSPQAVRILEAHAWNGNVRELQQVVERAAILGDGASTILPSHLYFFTGGRKRLAAEGIVPDGEL